MGEDVLLFGSVILGGGLTALGGYFWGRNRVAPPPEPTSSIHRHISWKKDMATNIYYCKDCGDRYLDGKPPK